MAAGSTGVRATSGGSVLVLLVAMVGAVALAAPADAARSSVLHVAKRSSHCTDQGHGTRKHPFCSITAAAAVAGPGQTVRVRAGRYAEQVVPEESGRAGSPVTYRAAPGARVVIHGQRNGFSLSGKSFVTIRGFVIRTTQGPGIKASSGTSVVVAGNDVARAGQRAAGRTAKGILLRSVIDAVVVGNTAHHNSNSGISVVGASVGARLVGNTAHGNARGYVRAAAGIDLRNAVSSTVSGNRAYANEDSGINIWAGSHLSTAVNNVVYLNGDHGIDVVQSDDATVVANTVYRNVDSGIEVSGSHRAVITNNITVDNGVDSPRTSGNIRADATSAPTTVIDYNLHSSSADLIDWAGQTYTVLAEFTSATGREAHGIQADPRFRDPAAADFRLTAASPAVDSADSAAPGQPAVDFDALPRVNAPGVRDTGTGPRTYDDRGAFEFHP